MKMTLLDIFLGRSALEEVFCPVRIDQVDAIDKSHSEFGLDGLGI